MSDFYEPSTIVDRLRGIYEGNAVVGPRDFSEFIPAIAIEAARRIDELEYVLQAYAKYGNKAAMETDIRLLNEDKWD